MTSDLMEQELIALRATNERLRAALRAILAVTKRRNTATFNTITHCACAVLAQEARDE